jgi:hypothetical protein
MLDVAVSKEACSARVNSEGDYKHATDVGLGVADLARRLHLFSTLSRLSMSRSSIARCGNFSQAHSLLARERVGICT